MDRFSKTVSNIPYIASRVLGWAFRLPSSLSKAVFFFIWPKQTRRRYRTVLGAVFLVSFLALNIDHPKYWNSFADFLNPKLEAVDMPEQIRRLDKWYALKRADDFLNIPYFWDLPFSKGLDLEGGIHLIYKADLSGRPESEHSEAMTGLRDIIERRVNVFGLREPQIFVQESNGEYRLIAELAGVRDFGQAINIIGSAPFLEFKTQKSASEQIVSLRKMFSEASLDGELLEVCKNPSAELIGIFVTSYGEDPCFESTGLTGQYLKSSSLNFDASTNQPVVNLELNDEGAKLFSKITEENVEKPLAIYLDGVPRSSPIVREKIETGRAQISGFNVEQAKSVTRDLNAGALPVKIDLISQQNIGASLGEDSINKSVKAGIVGLLSIAIFMIALYRLSGLVAVVSLLAYTVLFLAVIKLVPVTLTLPGMAGFILSIGMAVDANVLVFERLREEMKGGANKASAKSGGESRDGVQDFGFTLSRAYSRAWPSIRDGNISKILTCAILFWFSTSFIKGFALTLGIGLVISMFSSMIVSKYLMRLLGEGKLGSRRNMWIR